MNLVSKKEFEEKMRSFSRNEIIELLYKAYIELLRIEHRSQSLWYMKGFMYRNNDKNSEL